jgi:hypothetical protein
MKTLVNPKKHLPPVEVANQARGLRSGRPLPVHDRSVLAAEAELLIALPKCGKVWASVGKWALPPVAQSVGLVWGFRVQLNPSSTHQRKILQRSLRLLDLSHQLRVAIPSVVEVV